tara:strand:+ start:93 stop:794 length:702 start_codon:yes stop_codon:yes gene_type:complete
MKKYIFNNRILYFIYKLQKIYKDKFPNKHFAEFAEDVMINRIFKNDNKGVYVDIGAYHPYKGSLTYLLFKKGWRGMNIDLSKTSIDLFKIARPNDLNICCAISNKTEKKTYFENSPINQQNSLIRQNTSQKEIIIDAYRLDDLLTLKNFKNFDYLNIDTEGNEIDVLEGINFKKISPKLITIEENNFFKISKADNEKINFLEERNYILINIIGVTMFFYQKDFLDEISDKIKI